MKSFFNKIKRALCRSIIMEKILFRDLGYICMLICIPIIIFSVQGLSKEKSGMVKIAVVNENPDNEHLQQALEKMMDSSSVYFYSEEDADAARQQLEEGNIDAVWIFPEDIEERIRKYVEGKKQSGVILFYEGQESIILNMAREKAFEAIYSDVIYCIFSDYVDRFTDSEISEEELREIYEAALVEESIFEYHTISGEDTTEEITTIRLVSAPVKGILAVYIFFIALMVSLILIRDKKSGAMQRLSYMEEWLYCFFFRFVAVLNVSVIVWMGLLLSGNFNGSKSAVREILILFCYAFASCAAAQLIGEKIKSIYLLCSVSILLTISGLALCPVLIPLSAGWIAKLYPVNYYLLASNEIRKIYWIILYGLICFGINILVRFLGRKAVLK